MSSRQKIMVRNVAMGGGAPITIQSMTNTDTADVTATMHQISLLEEAGCEIIRISVYNEACAKAVGELREMSKVPLVADIHFSPQLAIQSIENGIDKLRINPGNIGSEKDISRVLDCAKAHHIPIRVGVNAGSLEKDIEAQFGQTAEGLVQSALRHVRLMESHGFFDIVVSIKSSRAPVMVEACRKMAKMIPYPLHLGVTEAGTKGYGSIKSAVGIGTLLLEGIGDTIRVSLSGDPIQEVSAAKEILQACEKRRSGVEIISCPTCGRCSIDVETIAKQLQQRTASITVPIRAAVMGCVVNGPGEAKDADVGLYGAGGECVVFGKSGQKKHVPVEQALNLLIDEIKKIASQIS